MPARIRDPDNFKVAPFRRSLQRRHITDAHACTHVGHGLTQDLGNLRLPTVATKISGELACWAAMFTIEVQKRARSESASGSQTFWTETRSRGGQNIEGSQREKAEDPLWSRDRSLGVSQQST